MFPISIRQYSTINFMKMLLLSSRLLTFCNKSFHGFELFVDSVEGEVVFKYLK